MMSWPYYSLVLLNYRILDCLSLNLGKECMWKSGTGRSIARSSSLSMNHKNKTQISIFSTRVSRCNSLKWEKNRCILIGNVIL